MTASLSPGGTSPTRSWRRSRETRVRDGHVQVRDQADMVPRLWGLRGPAGAPDGDPYAPARAVEHPDRLRDRMLEQPAALPFDVRIPCDPRTCAAGRGRREARESGSPGDRDRGRRRRIWNWRGTLHSRDASQLRHHVPGDEQPDLWTDDGPGEPD